MADKIAKIKKLEKELKSFCDRVMVCGSYRRGKEDPGDLDVIVMLKDRNDLFRWAEKKAEKITKAGYNLMQIYIDGLKVDLVVVDEESHWAASMLQWTGSWKFNMICRIAAKRKGWILNNRGLFDRETGDLLEDRSEYEILKALGMDEKFIEPSERNFS